MTGREQLPASLRREVESRATRLDNEPLAFQDFRFKSRSVVIRGKPSQESVVDALAFVLAVEDASPYWVGDLLAYAKSRGWWDEAMDIVADRGVAPNEAYVKHYVSTHVSQRVRKLAPSYTYARHVAKLPEQEQIEVLDRAIAHGWKTDEVKRHVRNMRRKDVIEAQGYLVGVYRVVVAAPRWSVVKAAELMKLPVPSHTCDNSVLFLRVTSAALGQDPSPHDVMRAWGFEPTGATFVWDRVDRSQTGCNQARHEFVLVGMRGVCEPDHPENLPDSVFVHRQSWDDSTTPRDLLRLFERLYDGPRLELFGSTPRDEWDVFGDDYHKWHEDAAKAAEGS